MSEDQKTALELASEAAEKKAEETNKSRMVDSGKTEEVKNADGSVSTVPVKVFPKGTLLKVGMTRGRNPQVISFEVFDESKPETLPATLSEFMELTKTNDEKVIVGYLLDGFNANSYTVASDPVAEFVEPTWSDEVQKQFRMVVRNYAGATGVSIEDAVALIKPGIVASQKKPAA